MRFIDIPVCSRDKVMIWTKNVLFFQIYCSIIIKGISKNMAQRIMNTVKVETWQLIELRNWHPISNGSLDIPYNLFKHLKHKKKKIFNINILSNRDNASSKWIRSSNIATCFINIKYIDWRYKGQIAKNLVIQSCFHSFTNLDH